MIPWSEVQDLDTAVDEAVGLTIEEAVRNVARHEERRLAHLFHQQMEQHIWSRDIAHDAHACQGYEPLRPIV